MAIKSAVFDKFITKIQQSVTKEFFAHQKRPKNRQTRHFSYTTD